MEAGRGIITAGILLFCLNAGTNAHYDYPPRGVTVIDDLTGGQQCERSRYYCAKGCEPSDPDAPTSPLPPHYPLPDDLRPLDEYPEYPTWGPYVEAKQTSMSPVTLYANENNDISVDLAMKFDTPFTIEGDDLWTASTWFSRYSDGSGVPRTNLQENALTRRQRDQPLRPETKFAFKDLDQNADLTSGEPVENYRYLCGEISKGSSPNPDFSLIKRKRFSSRGCTKATVKDRGSPDPKTVQFDSVTPSPVELYVGERNEASTDVAVAFNQANTGPDVAGDGLWQMTTWFSGDEDGWGRASGLVKYALTDEQTAKGVDNFNPLVFENVPANADLRDTEVGCGKYRYFCAQLRKGNPRPDYQQVGKSRAARTGCSPVSCRNRTPEDGDRDPSDPDDPDRDRQPGGPDRDRQPGDRDRQPGDRDRDPSDRDRSRYPDDGRERERKIEVVSTSTTPVTLYLDEVNDVTTDVDIAFDTDVYIQGSDLWEMSIWFSKQKDGSGAKTNLRDAVLSPRQRNKKVKPDKPLTYVELPQSVDLSDGTGCGKYRYICSELRKNNPNPDFKLTDRRKLSRRGCAQVTCKARGDDTYPTVQFAAVQPGPVTIYVGEKTRVRTNVDVKFKEANTDPNTAGEHLWQMSLWFSKQADGSGKTTDYIEITLNQAQGEMPVDFNNFVFGDLNAVADLRSLVGCGKHKYICARVRKDSPVPDYELIGKALSARTGCARVRCESRSPDDRKLELVKTTPTPVTLYKNERNPVTTDVNVVFDADYGVEGKKLWQMSLWFSKSPNGDGKKSNLRESVLSGNQRSKPIDIEAPLLFENLPQSVDLSGGVGCGKYKYICAEIRKLAPEPPFEYTLRKKSSPKGCARVSCIDRQRGAPTVEFQEVQPTPVTLTIGQNNRVTTDVTVEFNPATTDRDVAGKGLWDMSLWFSKSRDGVGSSTGFLESTLSAAQKKQGVAFGGDFEFTDLETSVDLRDAISCGKYRFICARIRKGDPQPDYNLIGRKSVTGCAPVKCLTEPEPEPLVIVSTSITPVTLYIGERINVLPDVTVNFEGEEGVSGSDLWEMSIWFNKNADGSGKKYDPAESTLSASQRDQTLDITQDLVFRDIEKSVDLTVVEGCGKFKYICAEIRKSNPSPPFEFEKKRPSSVRGCAKTSCEVREEPEPTVKFASTQPTGVTIYEEELNVVNTDVIVSFDESETDPTVAGERLWQMQLWFSKAADGQGSSIGTIELALSGEQANQAVSFSDFAFRGLEARADLTVTGCGKYKYLCARVRKDKPDPSYKLVGKDPSQTTGCAPVECLRGRDPTVQFASVQNTPVTVYEESRTPVTTTVTVTFEEDRTDLVSGSSLWQVDLWFSKANDGLGSRSDRIEGALSAAQAAKAVNFRNFVFDDLEIIADLSPESQGCGKYRFICAQIRRDEPEPTYKRLGKDRETTVGCSPVRCDKSQVPEVEFASVSNTPVSLNDGRRNTVTTTVSATFNRQNTEPSVAGTNLWQVRLWFSKASDGQGSSVNTVESALSSSQSSKAVNFNNFVFPDLEISADLSTAGCGKYKFICAQIRRDNPEPDFRQIGKSVDTTVGCSPVTCGNPTPHITPTQLTVTSTQVEVGRQNTIDIDVTINFDPSATDDVSGSTLWKVIVWLSDDGGGVAGSRIGETEDTISFAQKDQPLRSAGPLRFRNVAVDMNLRSNKCKYIAFVCARMKRDAPDPDFTMSPKHVTACAPCRCS